MRGREALTYSLDERRAAELVVGSFLWELEEELDTAEMAPKLLDRFLVFDLELGTPSLASPLRMISE